MLRFAALAVLLFPLSALADDPEATAIEDGTTTTLPFGLKFDVPSDWSVKQAKEGVYALTPEGANPTGVVEELYLFLTDKWEGDDPAGDDVGKELGKLRDGLVPGAEQKGDPEAATFGNFAGAKWCYEGTAQDGKKARLWFHVFIRNGHVCAIVALGYPKALKARKDAVTAILASCRKSKKRKAGDSAVRAELAGEWAWITNFTANNGGGRQTSTVLNLGADGTYTYKYEHSSDNPFGGTSGSESDSGTWTATETSITFKSAGGETRTCTLEKRNHPKNVNDPMLVIDGEAFVTTTNREPWK